MLMCPQKRRSTEAQKPDGAAWKSSNIWTMRFLLSVVVSAAALGVATAAVPGIELPAGSGWSKLGTLLVVALIFGVINATLKPLIKIIGCAFYVLTLGLAALVVNGLLLWLTSVIAGDLTLPFHVTGFWPPSGARSSSGW